MLQGKITLNKQEESGTYKWDGIPTYMTCGFREKFGDEADEILIASIALILKKYPNNANYFQTFRYLYPDSREIRFWVINDIDHITALLPSEY